MYIPSAFREDDPELLGAFARDHAFALLVSAVDGEPMVTHVATLPPERLEHGAVVPLHLAAANPHASVLAEGGIHRLVYQGPHGYVSPAWYTDPRNNVPTWNYSAVHVSGPARRIDEDGRRRALLEDVVQHFESSRPAPWRLDMDDEYPKRLLAGFVAFEMTADRVEGKFKLSQNKPAADRAGVRAGLAARPADRPLYELMAAFAGRGRIR